MSGYPTDDCVNPYTHEFLKPGDYHLVGIDENWGITSLGNQPCSPGPKPVEPVDVVVVHTPPSGTVVHVPASPIVENNVTVNVEPIGTLDVVVTAEPQTDDCILLDDGVLPPGGFVYLESFEGAEGSTRLSFQPCAAEEPVATTVDTTTTVVYPPPTPVDMTPVVEVPPPPPPAEVELPSTGSDVVLAWVAATVVVAGLVAVFATRRKKEEPEAS